MEEEKCIYEKIYNDYGRIDIKLEDVLKEKKISPYRLSTLTGINWNIIKRYMSGDLYRIDLNLLAKICYCLDCKVEDILIYNPNNISIKSEIKSK